MKKRKESEIGKIVRERIGILLSLAGKVAKTNLERARKYVRLARRLSERYRVRFTRIERMHFCKKCNSPFIPGYNVKIGFVPRFHRIVYECRNCGAEFKFPYKKGRD